MVDATQTAGQTACVEGPSAILTVCVCLYLYHILGQHLGRLSLSCVQYALPIPDLGLHL